MQSYVDETLSIAVALAIGAEPYRCWRNAALSVLFLPEVFAPGSYVEGWMVVPRKQCIEIVEHGWCMLPTHGIVDPSIVLIAPREHVRWYFPGYICSYQQLTACLHGSTLPLVCHSCYGDDGMAHAGYHAASTQAHQKAQEECKERHLAETAIVVSGRDASRGGRTVIKERVR